MSKNFHSESLRKAVSIITTLVMLVTLLPLGGLVAYEEESDVNNQLSTSSAVLNAEKEKPVQFDDMVAAGDVYGQGDNAFLLSEQNELYLYWSTKSEVKGFYYDNLDMTIVSEDEGYSWVDSINAGSLVENEAFKTLLTDGISAAEEDSADYRLWIIIAVVLSVLSLLGNIAVFVLRFKKLKQDNLHTANTL